ncbi:hypothetical protein [Angelakisella massiliensis]|uniref:hypothetical protein n=1 Tax=Angelakisella massiliensis TaxID=1871018 RepID=UPI0024B0B9A8|nr:hypothetical protein [Angelakisella massiliensis]
MKKILPWVMAVLLLTGCGASEPSLPPAQSGESTVPQTSSDASGDTLQQEAVRLWQISQPVYLDLEQTAALLGLKTEWLSYGWGVVSAKEECPDTLIFLSPVQEKEKKAEQSLEDRLSFLLEAFPGETTMGSVFLTGSGPVLAVTGTGEDPSRLRELLEERLGTAEEA